MTLLRSVANEMRRRRERRDTEYFGMELAKVCDTGGRRALLSAATQRWQQREPRWYRLVVAHAVVRLARARSVQHIPVGSVVVLHVPKPVKGQAEPLTLSRGGVAPQRKKVSRGPQAAIPERVKPPKPRVAISIVERQRQAAVARDPFPTSPPTTADEAYDLFTARAA